MKTVGKSKVAKKGIRCKIRGTRQVIKKRGAVLVRRGYTSNSPLAPRDKILRRGFPSHSPLADG